MKQSWNLRITGIALVVIMLIDKYSNDKPELGANDYLVASLWLIAAGICEAIEQTKKS